MKIIAERKTNEQIGSDRHGESCDAEFLKHYVIHSVEGWCKTWVQTLRSRVATNAFENGYLCSDKETVSAGLTAKIDVFLFERLTFWMRNLDGSCQTGKMSSHAEGSQSVKTSGGGS